MNITQMLFDEGADPYKCNLHGHNSFEFAKGIGADFLNVQMCIWYNERKTSVKNQLNITGNILNVRPSPITVRRRSIQEEIQHVISNKKKITLSIDSPSVLRRASYESAEYIRNHEKKVLERARSMSLPGIFVNTIEHL